MRGARICSTITILILFLALVLLPISTLAEELTRVAVQNKDFEVIKEIRNQNGLLEFRDHSNKKEKVQTTRYITRNIKLILCLATDGFTILQDIRGSYPKLRFQFTK